MKELYHYICLVDSHKNNNRNTKGRYIVCAKTAKEAKKILQNKIGFGSITVYYKVEDNGGSYDDEKNIKLAYKEVKKIKIDFNKPGLQTYLVDVKHATDLQDDLGK